jgi:pimeloyl-ACP methyl ester carboxylesterase
MSRSTTRISTIRRISIAVAALAFVSVALTACSDSDTGTVNHAAAKSSLHMVSTNGHELAFHVTPGHLPAIVLDAGGGNYSSYWSKIVPVLSARTGSEVITYDRPGEGKSPAVAGPFIAQDAASDLHAGLTKLGVTRDVVLVSHSLAGEIAMNLVKDYPKLVAGSVLIDASLPTFYTPAETARIVAVNTPQIAAVKTMKQTDATRQLIAEAVNYGPVHLAYSKMAWPKGIPTIIIVSSKTPYPTTIDANRWRVAQKQFADEASNRRLVVAAHSSHDIPIDRPQLVLTEIQDMVNQSK